jgi:hypothetical protein
MLVCDSVASLLAVFQQVFSSDALQIMRLKNRLVQPADGGWGGCLLNLFLKEDRVEKHVFELQIVPKSMLEVRTIGAHHDYAAFCCARELLEACGYDVTEGFDLTDLRKAIKHMTEYLHWRGSWLSWNLCCNNRQSWKQTHEDWSQLTTALHRVTTELAEVRGRSKIMMTMIRRT